MYTGGIQQGLLGLQSCQIWLKQLKRGTTVAEISGYERRKKRTKFEIQIELFPKQVELQFFSSVADFQKNKKNFFAPKMK